ncbi:hypothetical protein BKA81DRAFT_359393 [Phyllosticta paracitricarpa]
MRLPFVVEQTSVGGPRVRWPVAIPRLDGRSRRKSIKRRKGLLLQKVLPQPEREREARASEKKNRQCGVFWSIQTKRASRSQDGDPLAVASFGGLAALLFLFSLRDTRPGVNLLLSDWPRSLSSLPSRNSGEIRSHQVLDLQPKIEWRQGWLRPRSIRCQFCQVPTFDNVGDDNGEGLPDSKPRKEKKKLEWR